MYPLACLDGKWIFGCDIYYYVCPGEWAQEFPRVLFFLVWADILLYKDGPVWFPFLCLNCSYLLPVFLWTVLLFSYQLVGNFNILNPDPLLQVYIADPSSQVAACLFTVFIVSLVTWEILVLMQVNFFHFLIQSLF